MKDHDLDRLLRSYSDQEPRAGIEERVLHRIRSGPPYRGLRWLLVPVLAGLAAAIAVWNYRVPEAPLQPFVKTVSYVPPAPVSAPHVKISGVRHSVREQSAPGLRVTPEERALVQFAAADPERLSKSLDDVEKRSSEPVQIAELKIEPLEIQ
jgi:hypothetical protein